MRKNIGDTYHQLDVCILVVANIHKKLDEQNVLFRLTITTIKQEREHIDFREFPY